MTFSFKNVSIRYKLMLLIMLVSSIVLVIASSAFIIIEIIEYQNKIESQLLVLADVISDNNTANLTFDASDDAQKSLNSLKADKHIIAAYLYKQNGKILAKYHKDNHVESPKPSPLPEQERIIYENNNLILFKPILFNNETIGTIYIKSDLKELNKRIKSFLFTGFVVLITSLIVAFIISLLLQKIISKPILKLALLERRVSETKDYSLRMEKKANDEIGALIGGFNEMLSQIEKQNNEITHATEAALEAKKAKEMFLANMSHEIRTPMNVILGVARLLEETKPDINQQKYIKAILNSGDNLLVIINDILDSSKIEAGKIRLEKIGFRINDVIENIVQSSGYKIENKNLKIKSIVDIDPNTVVMGDPYRLTQILVNLVNNAIKFTDKGQISVNASILETNDTSATFLFRVRDTGIGIPENKLNAIFESFMQADDSTTRRYGGTGLGLSICKSLVELQGGKISVESIVNEGSVFRFTITYPLGKVSDIKEKEKLNVDTESTKKIKILCADDHEMNRFLAVSLLQQWGFKVDAVSNGKECVEKIKTHSYDLILMDMQMPVMDGIEATKIIRTELSVEKNNIPIIALTANALERTGSECIEEGMNDFVIKPFDHSELYSKIMKLVKISSHNSFQSMPEIAVESSNKNYDISIINSLSNNNNQFVKSMVESFVKETEHLIEEIESALTSDNIKIIKQAMHKLKPSLEYVGLSQLNSDIDFIMSYNDENKEFENINKHILYIVSALQKTICALKKDFNEKN